MWSRANLKANAKVAFKRNYWKCVLVALILGIASGAGGAGSAGTSFNQNTESIISNDASFQPTSPENIMNEFSSFGLIEEIGSIAITSIIVIIVLVVLVITFVLHFFLFGPLAVGCNNFFKSNAYEQADLNKLTVAFQKKHYIKMASTMFLKDLYIGLWMLLLIVPGVIKAYEYRMIPYILTDCPDISRQDAFRISKEMMMGNKMNAFILDLSFLGWSLLAVVTCGIVGVFYVNPYIHATDAELFIAIREEYFRKQRGDCNENNVDHGWEN